MKRSAMLAAVILSVLSLTVHETQATFTASVRDAQNSAASATGYASCLAAINDSSLSPLKTFPLTSTASPGGTFVGTATDSTSFACSKDTHGSVAFTNACLNATTSIAPPTVFTLQIRFRTTAAKVILLQLNNSAANTPTIGDRMLFIGANGRLRFGVAPGAVETFIESLARVDDGQWHHAAATLGSAGMALYLDGIAVASNTTVATARVYPPPGVVYTHVGCGYGRFWNGLSNSADVRFSGDIQMAAVQSIELTAAQISLSSSAA